MCGAYVIVTPFFPSPENWRGAYCYDFVVALRKTRRCRVEVFVPGKGADYELDDIKVHRFATWQLPSNIFPFLLSGRNQKSFLRAIGKVGLDVADIAVCHAHTANLAIYPLAVKQKNKCCLTLLHHHDKGSFGLNTGVFRHCWLYNMIEFPILRMMHARIDCHVFISEASRRSFLSAPNIGNEFYDGYIRQMRWLPYCPVKIKNSIILHNGVNLKLFDGDRGRTSDTLDNCSPVVGCIGNFIESKHQIGLLKAIIILRGRGMDIKIIFIGSGPEMEKCKSFAADNNINAEFRSEVRHEDLPEFYRSIDLFVLPSHFEGFGCVFTESWACGTPFITCEGQGMDDMIPEDERSLWLCKPRDPNDLATKIGNYLRNRPMQHLAAEIDIDKLVPEFVEKIESLRKRCQ